MPVRLPETTWPSELMEQGPPEDPTIVLSAMATIGLAPYRMLAVRVDPSTLEVDYRANLDEAVYADFQLDELVDDLAFLDELDASVLVTMGDGEYVVWVMPYVDLDEES